MLINYDLLLQFFFCEDLVPRENVVQWLKYLREEFPAVAFKANTQSQKHHLVRVGKARLSSHVHQGCVRGGRPRESSLSSLTSMMA